MGRQRKRRQKGNSKQPPSRRPGRLRPAMIVPAVAVIIAAGLWWGKARPPSVAAPIPPAAVESAPLPAAAAVTQSDFQKLKGGWLRPDGGYLLEIRAMDDRGNLDASYLNPRPIHIARAEASREGGAIKVFIELRDVNYPGSTYNLLYDPEKDQFRGVYYHAGLQQIFEVVFVRSAASP